MRGAGFRSGSDEPFAEHDGELGLCLGPLARRHFPFLGDLTQDQEDEFRHRLVVRRVAPRSHGAARCVPVCLPDEARSSSSRSAPASARTETRSRSRTRSAAKRRRVSSTFRTWRCSAMCRSPRRARRPAGARDAVTFHSHGGWFRGVAHGVGHRNAEIRTAPYRMSFDAAACLRSRKSWSRRRARTSGQFCAAIGAAPRRSAGRRSRSIS